MKHHVVQTFALTVVSALLAVFALVGFTHAPSANAAGAALAQPSSSCAGSNATVAFQWQQLADASTQYLDLSVQDDTFVKDSFAGTQVTGSSFTWTGLQANAIHWWRLDTLTSAGWQASATGIFVPCGYPAPLTVNSTCADANNANLDFAWAPLAGPNGSQYIDISQDQTFPDGKYQGAGPIGSGVGSYRWANVKTNTLFYYRINQRQNDGTWKASPIKTFTARCGAPGSTVAAAAANLRTDIYGSNDQVTIPGLQTGQRCSSYAPVNVRDVGADGQLGDPATDCDVVRYNFALFPGFGGYPGDGGATVIAGHVDYSLAHEGGTGAVVGVGQYWKNLREGDTIQYVRGSDGKTITYRVSWVSHIGLGDDFNYATIAQKTSTESLSLITCGGTWHPEAHEYDQRTVVYALRVS